MPGYALAIHWIASDPPEQPEPIVYRISPYCSTSRSFAMISDSAWTAMLQLWPELSSAVDMFMKPLLSEYSAAAEVSRAEPLPVTSGAPPVWWSTPHDA